MSPGPYASVNYRPLKCFQVITAEFNGLKTLYKRQCVAVLNLMHMYMHMYMLACACNGRLCIYILSTHIFGNIFGHCILPHAGLLIGHFDTTHSQSHVYVHMYSSHAYVIIS